MNQEAITRVLEQAGDLHSSPHVAAKVLHIVRNDDFDVVDVVNMLQQDPALSASVLRLVNSSYYGLANKVDGLRQAVALIGRRSLRLAVLSFGLVDVLTKGVAAEIYLDFWRRAFTTAALASRLKGPGDRDLTDQAYTTGLLADLGVLVLMQAEPDKYQTLLSEFPHGRQLTQAEMSTFGFDHALLGGEMLKRWGLPEQVCEAVAAHHDLHGEGGSLTHLIQTADAVNDFIWYPSSAKVPACRQLLESDYGIDMDGFIMLTVEVKDLVVQSEEIFGVKVLAEVDPEAIRKLARHLYHAEAIQTARELESTGS